MQIQIPSSNLREFAFKIAKLNVKAKKLSCQEVTYTVSSPFIRQIDGEPYEYVTVDVAGDSPVINGWSIGAIVEFAHGTTTVTKVGGKVDTMKLFDSKPICQHCNTSRRRNFTYLLYRDSEEKIVGKSCLKDFTGHAKPENILAFYSYIREFEEEVEEELTTSSSSDRSLMVRDYLARVIHVVESDGGEYYSRAKADEHGVPSTSSLALGLKVTNDDLVGCYRKADEVIAEVPKLLTGKNEFEQNLLNLLSSEFCSIRMSGTLAYAVEIYRKDLRKKLESASDKNEFFGEVGARVDLELTLMGTIQIPSYEYFLIINRFKDSEGRTFVWVTGKRVGDMGAKFKIRGTIKKHEDYRGEMQTQLSRCKVECII